MAAAESCACCSAPNKPKYLQVIKERGRLREVKRGATDAGEKLSYHPVTLDHPGEGPQPKGKRYRGAVGDLSSLSRTLVEESINNGNYLQTDEQAPDPGSIAYKGPEFNGRDIRHDSGCHPGTAPHGGPEREVKDSERTLQPIASCQQLFRQSSFPVELSKGAYLQSSTGAKAMRGYGVRKEPAIWRGSDVCGTLNITKSDRSSQETHRAPQSVAAPGEARETSSGTLDIAGGTEEALKFTLAGGAYARADGFVVVDSMRAILWKSSNGRTLFFPGDAVDSSERGGVISGRPVRMRHEPGGYSRNDGDWEKGSAKASEGRQGCE
ncbi:hypothetical protein FB45DRAFT_1000335 [Roridomyces roridus]|uniref:Uncharacterized protein n=1 Tax=Roridomyces roridus TaxID=1738132 RepID=A0AAD7C8K6_9AGAR|nr:hypothetical protein FB45DRAFT_1000335 [Roridomyces roridus]